MLRVLSDFAATLLSEEVALQEACLLGLKSLDHTCKPELRLAVCIHLHF